MNRKGVNSVAVFRCITNNPMILNSGIPQVEYHETDVLSLFRLIQPEIDKGYALLSHPLTGSIRPDITPYKTVLLSAQKAKADQQSLQLIDRAIRYAEELYSLREKPLYLMWDDQAKKDFQYVDLSIIRQAMEVEQIR